MHAHSRWTGELIASVCVPPRTEFSSPTAGSLEVARLPLHWGPVLDQVFRGRIDFFRRQEHHCPYARAPRLANGKGERGGTLVVRKVGDGEGVMVAEAK